MQLIFLLLTVMALPIPPIVYVPKPGIPSSLKATAKDFLTAPESPIRISMDVAKLFYKPNQKFVPPTLQEIEIVRAGIKQRKDEALEAMNEAVNRALYLSRSLNDNSPTEAWYNHEVKNFDFWSDVYHRESEMESTVSKMAAILSPKKNI